MISEGGGIAVQDAYYFIKVTATHKEIIFPFISGVVEKKWREQELAFYLSNVALFLLFLYFFRFASGDNGSNVTRTKRKIYLALLDATSINAIFFALNFGIGSIPIKPTDDCTSV